MIDSILVKNIPYSEIPDYLNISDIAFAIRLPKISMKGVAPIKLGEYMLMGLPIIASEGIGDTEEILSKTDHCYLYRHSDFENMENDIDNIEEIITFVNIKAGLKSEKIRELGCEFYSLENSVESYLKPFEKLI
jgi:glycosyltransferase involved in cell wall biosynthesis